MENMYPNCSVIVREVEVGGQSKAELIREFHNHLILMNEYGDRLFADDHFTTSSIPYKLKTVELTVQDIGFPEGATTAQILAQANSLNLKLCPLELGPFLRLQYLDQPVGFWITIASAKISDDPHFPNGFYLRRRDDGLWLRGYRAEPQHIWSADDHFVFCVSD